MSGLDDRIIRDLRRSQGKAMGKVEKRLDRHGNTITDHQIRLVELEKWVRVLAADRNLGWPTNRPVTKRD